MNTKLEKFTKEFESEFGDTVIPVEDYYTIDKMPSFAGKIVYEPVEKPKKLMHHRMLATEMFQTADEAAESLINKIKKFAKSVIYENHGYKHYSLFWRFRPEIEHPKGFELSQNLYRGYARLSIVEGNYGIF